ncbi:DNA-binding protein HEXBP-like [Belonocnema kinseyi]|uniref:DNA-binding protein HEXBP-like n=1 Tax=Belonocnema kinseyi TaxID=2817044 RepID=UPI00143DC8DB|nr:DNA-binding protein HEXBP-like [Belonocnema kinseyi]
MYRRLSSPKNLVSMSKTSDRPRQGKFSSKSLRGCIQAFIELDDAPAARLEKAGRLKVGWVSCQVKALTAETRCYRCHEFGHIARDCEGEDRSKICWRCDEEGHKSSVCQNLAARLSPSSFKKKV